MTGWASQVPASQEERYRVLDGWRGISISLVLWGHLFPAGPAGWGMNDAVATSGMAIFFTLSGFLITTFLVKRPDAVEFLIRRIFRIVPLAWLYVVIVLSVLGSDVDTWLAHLLFYVNLPPFGLSDPTSHLWSLGVEMHFYAGMAMLVGVLGKRGLFLIPIVAVAVTGFRVVNDVPISIVTWLRVDEILGGSLLALGFHRVREHTSWRPPMALTMAMATLLLASGHPSSGSLQFMRPYISAALVGSTLLNDRSSLARWLSGRVLGYMAYTSYALYIFHGGLRYTWLGTGEKWVKYAKRPLLLAVTFGLAHLSTRFYERRFIDMGHSLARQIRQKRAR